MHFTQIENYLNRVRIFAGPAGQMWWTAVVVFRVLTLVGIGSSVYGDEQGAFKCDTIQPGCSIACYNRFSPMSHIRFWAFNLIFVTTPAIFFYMLAMVDTAKIKKIIDLRSKIDHQLFQIYATQDELNKLKDPIKNHLDNEEKRQMGKITNMAKQKSNFGRSSPASITRRNLDTISETKTTKSSSDLVNVPDLSNQTKNNQINKAMSTYSSGTTTTNNGGNKQNTKEQDKKKNELTIRQKLEANIRKEHVLYLKLNELILKQNHNKSKLKRLEKDVGKFKDNKNVVDSLTQQRGYGQNPNKLDPVTPLSTSTKIKVYYLINCLDGVVIFWIIFLFVSGQNDIDKWTPHLFIPNHHRILLHLPPLHPSKIPKRRTLRRL